MKEGKLTLVSAAGDAWTCEGDGPLLACVARALIDGLCEEAPPRRPPPPRPAAVAEPSGAASAGAIPGKRRKWSEADTERLRTLSATLPSVAAIAAEMGWHESNIRFNAGKHGLTLPKGRG